MKKEVEKTNYDWMWMASFVVLVVAMVIVSVSSMYRVSNLKGELKRSGLIGHKEVEEFLLQYPAKDFAEQHELAKLDRELSELKSKQMEYVSCEKCRKLVLKKDAVVKKSVEEKEVWVPSTYSQIGDYSFSNIDGYYKKEDCIVKTFYCPDCDPDKVESASVGYVACYPADLADCTISYSEPEKKGFFKRLFGK